MDTFQFLVALARDAGAPFALALVGVAAAVSAPFVISSVQRASLKRARLSVDRDIQIKRLETSVRNGAVALAKPTASEGWEG